MSEKIVQNPVSDKIIFGLFRTNGLRHLFEFISFQKLFKEFKFN